MRLVKKQALFAYHNHDAEFREVEGKVPYQMMLSQLDAGNVKFELDLAWAIKGGADPVELFKKHPGRFPLWHIKDLDATHEIILPAGSGTIDFKRIFNAASTSGMKHFCRTCYAQRCNCEYYKQLSTFNHYIKRVIVFVNNLTGYSMLK